MKDDHNINSGMKMKAKKKQKRSDKVSGTFTGKGIYRDDVFQPVELSISGLVINIGCYE